MNKQMEWGQRFNVDSVSDEIQTDHLNLVRHFRGHGLIGTLFEKGTDANPTRRSAGQTSAS